ncbi:MAG: precorrin-3B synthase [Leptolyngbyaceae cyanobacterium CRU_2_3]|nr:precorrin-3B synthase [Leptolyngbyaceae cyanobacterium CRU_2_3]
MAFVDGRSACPGLFYATPAQDGMLSRIRLPGGHLTVPQCQAIGQIADRAGIQSVQVTNRANLQLRSLQALDSEMLEQLRAAKLAAPIAEVDALRNIMTSPIAGLDPQEQLDPRPLVVAWDNYLCRHPELARLSAKFSVCFDGGGSLAVWHRPNDIALVVDPEADLAGDAEAAIALRLYVSRGDRGESPVQTGISIRPQDSLALLSALAAVYLQGVIGLRNHTPQQRAPRLRQVIQQQGWDSFLQAVLQAVEQQLGHRLLCSQSPCPSASLPVLSQAAPMGVHPQRQPGLSYCGVGLPLGQLTIVQLRGLTAIATSYGSKSLRLTPWQNLLIPDIPDRFVSTVQAEVEQLGLPHSADHLWRGLVACTGSPGCAASATDTKGDALALATALASRLQLDCPINIHFTGCEKSCAQHHPSDITCLGIRIDSPQAAAYRISVGGYSVERELYVIDAASLPSTLEQMLRIYQHYRSQPTESFSEFVGHYEIDQLRQLFQDDEITELTK